MHENEEFTRLWTTAQPKVAGFIAAVVPDMHEAEDLLQDVAVVCLRKFGSYDRSRSFVAWTLGIAKLAVLAAQRKHAQSCIVFGSNLIENLEEVFEELSPELDLRIHALRECVKLLKGRASKLVYLRYDGALRPYEIAERMGLTEAHARVLLGRVRSFLRECIERKLDAHART